MSQISAVLLSMFILGQPAHTIVLKQISNCEFKMTNSKMNIYMLYICPAYLTLYQYFNFLCNVCFKVDGIAAILFKKENFIKINTRSHRTSFKFKYIPKQGNKKA